MRVYEQVTKISKVAVVTLLLIFAVTAQAQWPKPTTPPAPATIPAFQTVPVGFEELGFIEYASVDALCDPVSSPPLDTTAGSQFASADADAHSGRAYTRGLQDFGRMDPDQQ